MIKKLSALEGRDRRHHRIRKTLTGTSARPRMSIFRSQKHIYAQLIDDLNAVTLISASSLHTVPAESSPKKKTAASKKTAKETAAEKPTEKPVESPSLLSKPFEMAKAVGKLTAQRALEKGISEIVFDRSGYKFHGRIKALADGAREGGLKF